MGKTLAEGRKKRFDEGISRKSLESVDRVLFHQYLWRKSNNKHRVFVVTRLIAEDLGVTDRTISRIFVQMETQGRIKMIRFERRPEGQGIWFSINDPSHDYPDISLSIAEKQRKQA